MIDRIPPQNIEAEQSVIGAMLIDKEAIAKTSEILRPEDFYRQDNRVIYEAILALYNKNEAVDLVTVTEQLKSSGKLDEIGGTATITALSNAVPTAANVIYHDTFAGTTTKKEFHQRGFKKACRCYGG